MTLKGQKIITSGGDMKWLQLSEASPEPGQRCLITFIESPDRVRICYFDNKESFETRNNEVLSDEDLHPDLDDTWFTEADDYDDWWETKYVGYWLPVPPPPSTKAQS